MTGGIDGLEKTIVHGGEFQGAPGRFAIAGEQHDFHTMRARRPKSTASDAVRDPAPRRE